MMKQLIVHIEYAPEIETEAGALERNIDTFLCGLRERTISGGEPETDMGYRFFTDLDAAYCWEEGGFGDD
jgi:hypothetical protein